MSKPTRAVIHWTAGHLQHALPYYHRIIDRQAKVHFGKFSIEDNCKPTLQAGKYAPHVAAANSYTIGIAMVGMWDAKGPRALGANPLTAAQWHACVDLTAELFHLYSIEVSQKTLAGHCEVAKLWRRPQAGKWDPWVAFPEWTWAAGLTPDQIGDRFRIAVAERLQGLSKAAIG